MMTPTLCGCSYLTTSAMSFFSRTMCIYTCHNVIMFTIQLILVYFCYLIIFAILLYGYLIHEFKQVRLHIC